MKHTLRGLGSQRPSSFFDTNSYDSHLRHPGFLPEKPKALGPWSERKAFGVVEACWAQEPRPPSSTHSVLSPASPDGWVQGGQCGTPGSQERRAGPCGNDGLPPTHGCRRGRPKPSWLDAQQPLIFVSRLLTPFFWGYGFSGIVPAQTTRMTRESCHGDHQDCLGIMAGQSCHRTFLPTGLAAAGGWDC